MRLGIVGIESSHVEQFIDYFSTGHRSVAAIGVVSEDTAGHSKTSVRVEQESTTVRTRRSQSELTATQSTRMRELLLRNNKPSDPTVHIGTPTQLAQAFTDQVDCVIIADRDASTRVVQTTPFLKAKLPVFLDKPLALDICDANFLLQRQKPGEQTVASCSAFRHHPEVLRLKQRLRNCDAHSDVKMSVFGSFSSKSPYGPDFYLVHCAEIAATIIDNSQATLVSGTVENDQRSVTISIPHIGHTHSVEIVAMEEDIHGYVPHKVVAEPNLLGIPETLALVLEPNYLFPTLRAWDKALVSGDQLVSVDQMLQTIEITRALASQHRAENP